jgi:hypothetical protein
MCSKKSLGSKFTVQNKIIKANSEIQFEINFGDLTLPRFGEHQIPSDDRRSFRRNWDLLGSSVVGPVDDLLLHVTELVHGEALFRSVVEADEG